MGLCWFVTIFLLLQCWQLDQKLLRTAGQHSKMFWGSVLPLSLKSRMPSLKAVLVETTVVIHWNSHSGTSACSSRVTYLIFVWSSTKTNKIYLTTEMLCYCSSNVFLLKCTRTLINFKNCKSAVCNSCVYITLLQLLHSIYPVSWHLDAKNEQEKLRESEMDKDYTHIYNDLLLYIYNCILNFAIFWLNYGSLCPVSV